MPNITYGVEMECYVPASIGQDGVTRALRGLGVNARTSGYGGRDYTVWQVKTDGSLHSAPRGYTGIEIVSPVLTWGDDESVRQLRVVSEYLKSIDAKVNASCGGHAHVYVGHLTADGLANLVENYYLNLDAVKGLIAPHRREGAGYSQPTRIQNVINVAANLRNYQTANDVAHIGHHGNHINGDWFAQRGTLEFRHRDGTTNWYKWLGWVGFIVALINLSERESVRFHSTETMLENLMASGDISETLADWALRRNIPAIELPAALREARERVSARVNRMMSLQGLANAV